MVFLLTPFFFSRVWSRILLCSCHVAVVFTVCDHYSALSSILTIWKVLVRSFVECFSVCVCLMFSHGLIELKHYWEGYHKMKCSVISGYMISVCILVMLTLITWLRSYLPGFLMLLFSLINILFNIPGVIFLRLCNSLFLKFYTLMLAFFLNWPVCHLFFWS